ncbi:MAG: hypothetical protein FJ405_17100, partial [Verrucomicrobia bacterium]|nr:hypothetical protein [Verrucomicrobiota bacterium]
EQHTLAWSSSGGRLFAGGADNRIRVWRISPQALETQNPILESRFAHEGALLNLALSPDGTLLASSAEDRTVKIWNAADLTEKISLPQQPDLSPALVFASAGRELVVGRLDGSLGHYDTSTGGNFTPAKPELTKLLPRGIQRGSEVLVELTGKNLEGVASLKIGHPGLKTVVVKPGGHDKISVKLKVESSTPRGSYSLTAMGPGGESGELKIWVDDLPNFQEDPDANTFQASALRGSLWGALEKPGDSDVIELTAAVGEMMVFDIASREIGSKLNPLLELYDPEGRLVAQETAFDGGEPLLAVKAAVAGKHRLVIKDDTLSGSPDHSYRIAFGPLRFVTSAFPLTLGANTEARIKLVGLNLPDTAEITLKAGEPGRQTLALDPELYRWRKLPELEITSEPVTVEREPNDAPDKAGNIALPGSASGRLWSEVKPGSEDADYYSFRAKAGERVIIETVAAQRGSPADTKIEVLDSMGKPVPRLLLQAVRNTAVNFRSAEANALGMRLDHYEEMELNEYLYLNGDVMKLFRMPQGPDSEMLMYSRGGKRRAFLDTTATAHPLDETGFIVSPKPLGTKLPNNGLPVFTLFYANDDDGDRTAGSDSRLFFTAPTEGDYTIRVTESLRSGSPRHFYTLRLRHPDPGFTATLEGANPVIAAGSGQTFTVRASRHDGFEGPIRVTLTGLPAGFESASPLLIEAGHDSVTSVITATSTAEKPSEADCARIQLTAQADVEGGFVSMNVGSFGTLRLADSKPKLLVTLEAYAGQDTASPSRSESPMEITIAPGQMIPAWLSIQRNGHQDVVTFEVNNLPHGVIVDNLGLNGITFLKEENARQIFLTASKWVEKQDRPFYAVENQAGRQTSRPIMLKVRPTAGETAAR